MTDIEIRSLHTIEEFHAAENLQRIVWNSDDLDISPTHVMLTAAKNGGVVLGAFAGAQLIGFVFGFICNDPGICLTGLSIATNCRNKE